MTDAVAAQGRASIKQGSKSFAMASRLFAPEMRDDAAMLYAWCRYADDVVDGQVMGHGQLAEYRDGQMQRLEELEARTDAALAGTPDDDPVFQGLARIVETHEIPHQHPRELLKGFRMDAEYRAYVTEADVLDYGYHVAGVVGVMMAHIMGVREAEVLDRASDLGIAFQLTNIARDVIDDAKADRVYVPADILRAASAPTDPAALRDKANWPAAHKAALALLDIAEDYYASAGQGLRALPFRCAWAVAAALKVYRQIGETLRREGPEAWEGRVSTTGTEKAWLALTAMGPAMGRKGLAVKGRSQTLYKRPPLASS